VDTERPSFPHIVIIGASTGGVEAVSRLLETLPDSFPVPIIVAQHLDPHWPSKLVTILSKHTSMPVRSLEDHANLEPATVFVVPADRMVDFADAEIRVTKDGTYHSSHRPLPSIDRLLTTAAESYGERLVAIILTGTGSDGTSGAHQVKAHDGTVIIQDPRTAHAPSMPRSLAPTSVDFVRDLDDIGPLLNTLVTDPESLSSRVLTDDDSLEAFLKQVQTRCNIDFSQYKTPTILRRLNRRLIATNTRSLEEYSNYLRRNPDEYNELVSSFLIKVTEFFRDPELFDYIRDQLLPDMIEDGKKRGNQLRFWSAGCATGEEAYSLAILLAETLGDQLNKFTVRIFATDIDGSAISYARRGVYPRTALKEVPQELIERYFTGIDNEYEINKQIRSMVVFGLHDLAQRSPFPSIDLILCRNVLIYFANDLQRRALQLFAFSLRDDGTLILGKSETVSPLNEYFEVEDQRLRVFQRHGGPVPIPVGPVDSSMFSIHRAEPHAPSAWDQYSSVELARASREAHRARVSTEKTENLLFHLPVGIVAVDQNYDIRMINDIARRFLGIHGTAVGEDLLHLVRTLSLEPLRDGIDRAFRSRTPVSVSGDWSVEMMDGERLVIDITCYRHEVDSDGGSTANVVVVLTDVTRIVGERQHVADERDRQQDENEQLRGRLGQLLETNERLLDANQELASANEELRSTNEQLMVSNEEAQAAAEEIETLNEELQTTNEELETLNEELQATVEELNATNEDMQARTDELQDERRTSEAERARLEAILVSMSDAVMLVDPQGAILLQNEACRTTFGADLSKLRPETDSGEPISRALHPQPRASRGEPFTMQFAVSSEDGSRRWYEASGQPIRDGLPGVGTVVVIRDITDRSLRLLQEEFMSVASHELRTPMTALRGYLEMLQQHISSGDERSQRYVSIALAMVERLIRLISDLLDVGRLQSGKFELALESTDLNTLTYQTVELAQSVIPNHKIEAELPGEPVATTADPMRVQQVLLNLLTNAAAYSPDSDRIQLRLRTEDEHAVIEVQDFGIGVPEEARSQIFSRFFQGEHNDRQIQRGLGLGLYISREIVRAHGGDIRVDSTPGEGSTFIVELPLRSEEG
jgi:two-component system, chemotaxis family, CheB/CheR fusion protein